MHYELGESRVESYVVNSGLCKLYVVVYIEPQFYP